MPVEVVPVDGPALPAREDKAVNGGCHAEVLREGDGDDFGERHLPRLSALRWGEASECQSGASPAAVHRPCGAGSRHLPPAFRTFRPDAGRSRPPAAGAHATDRDGLRSRRNPVGRPRDDALLFDGWRSHRLRGTRVAGDEAVLYGSAEDRREVRQYQPHVARRCLFLPAAQPRLDHGRPNVPHLNRAERREDMCTRRRLATASRVDGSKVCEASQA